MKSNYTSQAPLLQCKYILQENCKFSILAYGKWTRNKAYFTRDAADPISSGILTIELNETSNIFNWGSLWIRNNSENSAKNSETKISDN